MQTRGVAANAFRGWKSVLLCVAFAAITAPALAVPITYTFSGSGTGTVGATPFTNAAYTITLVGDTTAVTSCGLCQNVVTGTMTIAGIGTATITTSLIMFDNQGIAVLGFENSSVFLDQLDVANAAFSSYALATNIGPISGLTATALNQFSGLGSTLGPITMPSSGPVTFQAAIGGAPPPPVAATGIPTLGQYGLLLLALLTGALAALRLRSRRR